MDYRKAVSAVVYQRAQFLLTNSQGWDEDTFCFPQGGIEENETDREAVCRELHEELGTNQFEIVGQSSHVHAYEFDDRERDGYTRQRQTIWFVEFTGERDQIDVPNEEIQQVKWCSRDSVVPNLTFEEQRETYRKVLREWDDTVDSTPSTERTSPLN